MDVFILNLNHLLKKIFYHCLALAGLVVQPSRTQTDRTLSRFFHRLLKSKKRLVLPL